MGVLTREQILAANDIVIERVPVPEWGGDVLVRGLTGAERDAFEATVAEFKGNKVSYRLENYRARFLALCIVDENGKRIFSDADVEALGRRSARALNRVLEKARELSGLSNEDMEELTKNSRGGQSADSTSD